MKKIAYERPALVKSGNFGAVTAGSLMGCRKELIFSRPRVISC
ncbi:keywimysin-related RiPP [Actinoplanes missouriensis]